VSSGWTESAGVTVVGPWTGATAAHRRRACSGVGGASTRWIRSGWSGRAALRHPDGNLGRSPNAPPSAAELADSSRPWRPPADRAGNRREPGTPGGLEAALVRAGAGRDPGTPPADVRAGAWRAGKRRPTEETVRGAGGRGTGGGGEGGGWGARVPICATGLPRGQHAGRAAGPVGTRSRGGPRERDVVRGNEAHQESRRRLAKTFRVITFPCHGGKNHRGHEHLDARAGTAEPTDGRPGRGLS